MGDAQFQHRVLVPGNHDYILEQIGTDWARFLCGSYGVNYLATEDQPQKLKIREGQYVSVWGTPISIAKGIGSHRAIKSGNTSFSRAHEHSEEIARETAHIQPGTVDIMLTHTPPLGPDKELCGTDGPTEIRELVRRVEPLLYVCGHTHNSRTLTEEGQRWKRIGKTIGINAQVMGKWNHLHGRVIVYDLLKD